MPVDHNPQRGFRPRLVAPRPGFQSGATSRQATTSHLVPHCAHPARFLYSMADCACRRAARHRPLRGGSMARLPRRASGLRLAAALVLVSLALALSACTVPLLGEATPTPTPRPTPSPTAIPTPTPLPTPTPDPNLTPQQIYQRVSPAVVTIV